ncbi:MAG: DMT family transporter [Sphaerochaetaceae bacterium]|nr:DMT family transporter [Sphaerochaetaceae bacterium]
MDLIFGQLLALITALCWAQNSLIYSHVGARISSASTAHVRLWFAFPLILLAHLAFTGTWFPQGLSVRELSFLGLSGALGFTAADLFIFSALVSLGARFTMVIMTFNPLFSALFAWIFEGEVLTLLQMTGMSVTITGVVWVILAEGKKKDKDRDAHHITGVLSAFFGALTQATAMVLAKSGMSEGLDPIGSNLIRLAAGFLTIVIYRTVRGSFKKDIMHVLRPQRWTLVMLIFSAALVGPVFGMIVNLKALTLAPVGVVITLTQMAPVILIPIERFVLKQHIAPGAIGGTILAVMGTVLLFLF